MRFEELSHIIISVVTVSFAFAVATSHSLEVTREFATDFTVILFTVGLGFVLHELAHKWVAQKYGAWAEYRAWTFGLALALVMAIAFGFVFAAPGAVYISGGKLSRERNGKIAIAGALTNYALAIFFLLLPSFVPSLAGLAATGFAVNVFLAGFNLIPFAMLDGAKVYAWDKKVWLAAIAPALLFLLGAF